MTENQDVIEMQKLYILFGFLLEEVLHTLHNEDL
jgi:hypothetical protein